MRLSISRLRQNAFTDRRYFAVMFLIPHPSVVNVRFPAFVSFNVYKIKWRMLRVFLAISRQTNYTASLPYKPGRYLCLRARPTVHRTTCYVD